MALSRNRLAGRAAALVGLTAIGVGTLGVAAAWAGPQPSTLTVSPSSVTGGSAGNTLTFTYTSGNNVDSGTLRFSIPGPFSAPVAGNVSATLGAGCTAASPSVSNRTIVVQFACSQNGTFTVTDAGEAAPNKVQTDTFPATTTGAPIVASPSISVVAGPPAKFLVQGLPTSVDADVAASATVTAVDAHNNIVTGYAGTVKFSSSDPRATLPAPYTFVTADMGVHTFTGILFYTAGRQMLFAGDPNITGTARTTVAAPQSIVVSPSGPTVVRGQTVQFSASVSFPDSTTVNPDTFVTWTSSSPAVSISKTGLATGVLAGSSTISATLSGVFASTTLTVAPSASTTQISSSANPSASGQSVAFTATVAPQGAPGTATGTVTFSDGGTTLATQPLSGGIATLSSAALSVGSHSITANYNGDANNQASSATLTQVVSAAGTTTTVQSSSPISTYGQAVTFTATVTDIAPGSTPPEGTVIFTAGTNTLLGFAPVAADGTASITTSTLPVGATTVNAYYSPANGATSASSGSVVQTVNQATPTVSVTADNATVNTDQTVTFTVTVAGPGSDVPTGTVVDLTATGAGPGGTVHFGPATLDGNGHATYMVSFPIADTYSVVATYGGDTNNVAADNSASPWTETVVAPSSKQV
jgi:large repetitive protein